MAISMLSGFSIKTQTQNVERDSFKTLELMKNYDPRYLPPIFIATNEETGKLYIYNVNNDEDSLLGRWRVLEGSGEENIVESIVINDSELTVDSNKKIDLSEYVVTSWVADVPVKKNQTVIHNNKFYRAKEDIVGSPTFDETAYDLVGGTESNYAIVDKYSDLPTSNTKDMYFFVKSDETIDDVEYKSGVYIYDATTDTYEKYVDEYAHEHEAYTDEEILEMFEMTAEEIERSKELIRDDIKTSQTTYSSEFIGDKFDEILEKLDEVVGIEIYETDKPYKKDTFVLSDNVIYRAKRDIENLEEIDLVDDFEMIYDKYHKHVEYTDEEILAMFDVSEEEFEESRKIIRDDISTSQTTYSSEKIDEKLESVIDNEDKDLTYEELVENTTETTPYHGSDKQATSDYLYKQFAKILPNVDKRIKSVFDLASNINYNTVDSYADLLSTDVSGFTHGLYLYLVKQDENYPRENSDDAYYATIYLHNPVDGISKWDFVGKLNMSEKMIEESVLNAIKTALYLKDENGELTEVTRFIARNEADAETLGKLTTLKETDENGIESEILLFRGEKVGSGNSDEIPYKNDNHLDWNTVKKAIDGIIEKIEYIKPSITSFTATPSTTIYEKGQKVASLVFNWTLNKNVKTQTLTGCTLADASVRTATYDTEISAKKSFVLSVSDGENSASSTFTVDFQDKVYYGSSAEGTYDSAFILALSDKKFATAKKGSYAINVKNSEYGYIAYPKSFGLISEVVIGGFTYDVVNCGDVNFTNASGYSSVYNVIRTNKSGLGSITVEVK